VKKKLSRQSFSAGREAELESAVVNSTCSRRRREESREQAGEKRRFRDQSKRQVAKSVSPKLSVQEVKVEMQEKRRMIQVTPSLL